MSIYAVACDVTDGLRASEATVAVESMTGPKQYLRVDRGFLVWSMGNVYLPIGVVQQTNDAALVELPHPADSGAQRVWVDPVNLLDMGKVG